MPVTTFLHTLIASALPWIHAARLRALFDAVTSLLTGTPLSLTGLGRALPTTAKTKHAIKKIDRLLGNRHLQRERVSLYQFLAQQLLQHEKAPIVLVDWSHADDRNRLFILRACLIVRGRGLPLYEAAHSKENCPKFQTKFLKQLASLVPSGCQPIVITDAGFGRKGFAQVKGLGWHYVGRILNRETFALPGQSRWKSVQTLCVGATDRAEDLGQFDMTRHRFLTRVLRYQRPPKGRRHHGRKGQRSWDSKSKQCARRERAPWLLVTHLTASWDAKDVVKLYSRRMRIEESFRDLKSTRFGIGLEQQGSRTANRLQILLLIAAIATFAIFLCGLYACHQGEARGYQANTRKTSVLSLFFIGLQWLRRQIPVTGDDWRAAFTALRKQVQTPQVLAS